MIDRKAIVSAARSQIGRPFKHQGRRPDTGFDCIGLVLYAYSSSGHERILDHDRRGYGRQPAGDTLRSAIEAVFDRTDMPLPGDIAMFSFAKSAQHVGIVTDVGLCHAHNPVGGNHVVVEHALDDRWMRHLVAFYRLKGV